MARTAAPSDNSVDRPPDTVANVLIVDDDGDLAETMAVIVAAEGHQARVARNGAEGLAKIYVRRPDLILLDLEMPVLDGPAMVRRLAPFEARGELMPIVLLSGLPALETIASRLGTPYFLRKPFELGALVEIVAIALQGRSRSDGRASEG